MSGHSAHVEDQLAAYTADELDVEERAQVERHLQTCAACREALAQTQRIRALLAALAVPERGDLPARPSLADALLALPARERATFSDSTDPEMRDSPPPLGGTPPREMPGPRALTNRHARGATSAGRPSHEATRGRALPRQIVAVAAALLLVAMAAALFARLSMQRAPGGPRGVATATPLVADHGSPLAVGADGIVANADINDIQMLATGEAWAVGDLDGAAAIFHYTGGRWLMLQQTYPRVSLSSIAMTGADDGWAVGATRPGDLAYPTDENIVLHYSGGRWARVDVGVTGWLGRVRMSTADDGWIIGHAPNSKLGSLLLRYRDGVWTQVPNTLFAVTDIAMTGPDDGWAVGNDGTLAHFAGGRFTQWVGSVPGTLHSVRMLSQTAGWAVGETGIGSRPFVMRYDGRTWTTTYPNLISGGGGLLALAALATGEIWVAGYASAPRDPPAASLVGHYVDGRWRTSTTTAAVALTAISMVSPVEGWAVGSASSVMSFGEFPAPVTRGAPHAMLLHYWNGLWTPYTG